jgi:hypothetical protein
MRKVTQKIVSAFALGKPATSGNTTTDGNAIWLHGNRIAQREDDGSVWVTLADWPTVTTRERVNGLCEELGSSVRFLQKDFEQFAVYSSASGTCRASHQIDTNERLDIAGKLTFDMALDPSYTVVFS